MTRSRSTNGHWQLREEVLGPMHPDTATSLNNLAILYDNQGKYDDAEPLYKRALAVTEEVLGPMHPDTATSLNNLAVLYNNQGKYDDAEPLYQTGTGGEGGSIGTHASGHGDVAEQPGDSLQQPGQIR